METSSKGVLDIVCLTQGGEELQPEAGSVVRNYFRFGAMYTNHILKDFFGKGFCRDISSGPGYDIA